MPSSAGRSNSGLTSTSKLNDRSPSSGKEMASRSSSGSPRVFSPAFSIAGATASATIALRTSSATSLPKRFSISLRGARPMRNPGTCAVRPSSPNISLYLASIRRGGR